MDGGVFEIEVVRPHYRYIVNRQRWLTDGHPDHEDLAQETFAHAWKHRHSFDGNSEPLRLLNVIAKQQFCRWIGRQKSRAYKAANSGFCETVEPAQFNTVFRSEVARVVQRSMGMMTDKQRSAFEAVYFHDRTAAEYARSQRMTPQSAEQHIMYALKHVRQAFAGKEGKGQS